MGSIHSIYKGSVRSDAVCHTPNHLQGQAALVSEGSLQPRLQLRRLLLRGGGALLHPVAVCMEGGGAGIPPVGMASVAGERGLHRQRGQHQQQGQH